MVREKHGTRDNMLHRLKAWRTGDCIIGVANTTYSHQLWRVHDVSLQLSPKGEVNIFSARHRP